MTFRRGTGSGCGRLPSKDSALRQLPFHLFLDKGIRDRAADHCEPPSYKLNMSLRSGFLMTICFFTG